MKWNKQRKQTLESAQYALKSIFDITEYRTRKKINYLGIQRFKRLIHCFHFDLVCDVLQKFDLEPR